MRRLASAPWLVEWPQGVSWLKPCSVERLAQRSCVALSPVSHPAARKGVTLVELVVAIVLLTIGLGALAGTGTWIARESVAADRTERAAVLARSRLELLRLAPCTAGSGIVEHGDLIERWAVSAAAGRATADVSLTSRDGGGMRDQRYRSAFAC